MVKHLPKVWIRDSWFCLWYTGAYLLKQFIMIAVSEETCLITRFMFSAAHRVRFSPVYGNLHGHNYDVTIKVCVEGRRDLVLDIDVLRSRLQPVISSMEGKYLKAPGEAAQGLAQGEFVEVPCFSNGVTSECLAWYLLDRALGIVESVGVKPLGVYVTVCDSPINCFEARLKSS